MDIGHRTFVIHNINDRNEVLNALAELDTDGDFDGSNSEYIWEATKENGFESNQEFVINELNNNNKLNGMQLVYKFFKEWLDEDSYYENYYVDDFEHNGETIVTVIYSYSTYD